MNIVLLFGFAITILCLDKSEAKVSCKNEAGQDVDWFIFYKIPKVEKTGSDLITKGEAYAYLQTPLKGQTGQVDWKLSKFSVEDEKSVFGRAYGQVFGKKKKLAYVIYNDQEPNKNNSASSRGHVKGIVATDGITGLWLVHSVPKFPEDPSQGQYDYPDNGKNNGQSGICITFKFETLTEIISLLRYSQPNIYARKTIDKVEELPQEIATFFKGKTTFVKKEPWSITNTVKSQGGEQFKAFSKHKNWDNELYDALIAPELGTSLYTETWQSGSGGKLPTECEDKFKVYNVQQVELDFGKTLKCTKPCQSNPDKVVFQRTEDHSKWGVSLEQTKPWICFGDINRMDSQRKRGGGAVCLKNQDAWKVYSKSVAQFEGCQRG